VTAYGDDESDSHTGWSPGAVVLVATMVLVLGLGGAVVGVYFANQRPSTPNPGTTLAADLNTGRPTPSPSASPTPSSSPIVTPTGAEFELPNVVGADFRQARDSLRGLKLGVNVVFDTGGGSDLRVLGTRPGPGETVRKGTTVRLTVAGAAPLVSVPNLAGLRCSAVAAALGEAGLFPSYPTGRKGFVLGQDPTADATTAHWNDTVAVTCGEPSPSASGA
jgi:hypothetical protein